ncbi:MAG: DUF503 domain-containing protein [bacterium]
MKIGLPGVTSLKEKRRILKSLMQRLRNDFNLSVSEVGLNDVHRQALVAAAVVANEGAFAHAVIDKAIDKVRSKADIILGDFNVETY